MHYDVYCNLWTQESQSLTMCRFPFQVCGIIVSSSHLTPNVLRMKSFLWNWLVTVGCVWGGVSTVTMASSAAQLMWWGRWTGAVQEHGTAALRSRTCVRSTSRAPRTWQRTWRPATPASKVRTLRGHFDLGCQSRADQLGTSWLWHQYDRKC